MLKEYAIVVGRHTRLELCMGLLKLYLSDINGFDPLARGDNMSEDIANYRDLLFFLEIFLTRCSVIYCRLRLFRKVLDGEMRD